MRMPNSPATRVLLTAGMVEVVAGLLHFGMPYFAYRSRGFSFLDPNEISFVTAGVFSVGILLTAFGALTVYFPCKEETPADLLFCLGLIQSVLWLARIMIEIAYPIRLSLFLIRQPTVILLPLFIFECLLFMLVTLLIHRNGSTNVIRRNARTTDFL